MKADNRPSKGMWAPGKYYCLCISCDEEFAGDKRSIQCADCAYKPEECSRITIHYGDNSLSFDTSAKIETSNDLIPVLLELIRVLETSNKAQYQ